MTPILRGVDGHDLDHFFRGVCTCSCGDCTLHLEGDRLQCTCPACDRKTCGLRLRPTPLSVKR